MDSLFHFLNSIHKLSPESEKAIRAICNVVAIKRKTDLHPIGHACRSIYFVKSGLLRIFYLKDGIDITESFEFENSIVARADSLFNGTPSRKGIQSIEKSEVIAISSSELFELYKFHRDIESLFRKIFELAWVETVNRIESIQFHSAEERYQNLNSKYAGTLHRVPLKFIASFLGITQVSLSRIRARR